MSALSRITEEVPASVGLAHFPPGEFSAERIFRALVGCGPAFFQALTFRTDPSEYACKLAAHADALLATNALEDVGLCCLYLNDPTGERAFLTHLGVALSQQGKGIARELLAQALRLCKCRSFRTLDLEVEMGNGTALALYLGAGFRAAHPDVGAVSVPPGYGRFTLSLARGYAEK